MAQRLGKAAMAEAENPRISALSFKILAECPVSKARVAKMALPHHTVDTPVFMPVGTQGTLKGMTPKQLEDLDCQILLGNTYHLGNRPVCVICSRAAFISNYSSAQLRWSLSVCLSRVGLQNPGTDRRAAQVYGMEPGTANGEISTWFAAVNWLLIGYQECTCRTVTEKMIRLKLIWGIIIFQAKLIWVD